MSSQYMLSQLLCPSCCSRCLDHISQIRKQYRQCWYGGTSSKPGRYLLTYRLPNLTASGDNTYIGYIYLPTLYGAIDLRIQVNGSDDVKEVNALQVQFILRRGLTHPQVAPELTRRPPRNRPHRKASSSDSTPLTFQSS